MTTTRVWLERRRIGMVVREGVAIALATLGWIAGALGLGVWLGRAGAYVWLPELVLLGWMAAVTGVVFGVVWIVRRVRRLSATALATEVETGAGLRHGSVGGLTADLATGSDALAALADRNATSWLTAYGDAALADARAVRARALMRGLVFAAAGVVLFGMAGPRSAAGFWRPLEAINRARGPVALTVDRTTVRRGDSVIVAVTAAGRRAATLYVRATGQRWEPSRLALDSMGTAVVILGPLESDRFLHATSGGRTSDTLLVRVSVPAFLADLSLVVRYPAYLQRADEPLAPGPEPVLLPIGTRIQTRGRLTVGVARAAWVAGERSVELAVDGTGFSGALPVTRSAGWTLQLTAANGSPLEGTVPALTVVAVPDSVPEVSVPVPGADTTAPTTLRQPLVVDVRDDHRVTAVEVISRRVSRLGTRGDPVIDTIPLPPAGVERAVLQWILDLNGRGFLPGDTAYFRVRARDNAPTPHVTETREFALRLPSLSELRQAAREQARALATSADSLARRQRELLRSTEDLAAERDRAVAGRSGFRQGDEQLGFRSAERAGEVSAEQSRLLERARELSERLDELAEAAWSAGLTDPQWHRQLADLQALLDRAITSELERALEALRQAMQRLDAPDVREALQRLAEAQREFRLQLERSRTLFERAALEGEMTTLAEDADELAQRQREWNRVAERSADSALAEQERLLAAAVDSLAQRVGEMERAARETGAQPPDMASVRQRAQAASQNMQQAAQAASRGEWSRARQQGGEASSNLDPIAQQLRDQRDELRELWRREVLEAMDHALVETAQLARRQEEIQGRLSRGDASPDLRSAQAAVRDGVDRVVERLQNAAGKNALVSPRLGTALGLATHKMTTALENLQQANPNTRSAGREAGEALDALNSVAHQLLRSRSDVAGAASGSGLQELIERLAELAQQQNSMAGQASGMLPLMQFGGEMLMQELRLLAQQQRALAQELERMRARGDQSGAGELADEARELARQLDSGVLNREMVERQERLYRRLLDAGRTLRGNEEDEAKERSSRTGRADNVLVPQSRPPESSGPRYAYPSWEQLRRLSPEVRRMILDYFRRLNEWHRGGDRRRDQ